MYIRMAAAGVEQRSGIVGQRILQKIKRRRCGTAFKTRVQVVDQVSSSR